MRLFALAVVQNDEDWVNHSLTAVIPYVEGLVMVDRDSRDRTRDLAGKAVGGFEKPLFFLREDSATPRAMACRQGLIKAVEAGASHLLLLAGAPVYPVSTMIFCRRLLAEVQLLDSRLEIPPRQHGKRHDPETTDGVLVRHLALPALRPLQDCFTRGQVMAPAVSWLTLEGLQVTVEGAILEPTGEPVATSPWRLDLPTTGFWDFSSPRPEAGDEFPDWARLPEVIKP